MYKIFLALISPALFLVPALSSAASSDLFPRLSSSRELDHYAVVNPRAPKGGELRLTSNYAFETLNPFGVRSSHLTFGESFYADYGMVLFQTLMEESLDEFNRYYGLVAEAAEIDLPNRTIIFRLDPRARWHDGSPISATDVIASFNILKAEGNPYWRSQMVKVEATEIQGDHAIRFVWRPRLARFEVIALVKVLAELPLIPREWTQRGGLSAVALHPPVASGPYRLARVEMGRSAVFERVVDHWAKDHPVYRGRYNFDRIDIDIYRDTASEFLAFQRGDSNAHFEFQSSRWVEGYGFPAARDGRVVQAQLARRQPGNFQGLYFNTRRERLKNRNVREALSALFDVKWIVTNVTHDLYRQTFSLFPNSPYETTNPIANDQVRSLLVGVGASNAATDFVVGPTHPNQTRAGRELTRHVLELFHQAGWTIRDRRLVNAQGEQFKLEILSYAPSATRVFTNFVSVVRRFGIDAAVVEKSPVEYRNRIDDFEFDLAIRANSYNTPPIVDLRSIWSSGTANVRSGYNLSGVANPVVDRLIDQLEGAESAEQVRVLLEAFDRLILSEHYVIPLWHDRNYRIAYWRDELERPPQAPIGNNGMVDTWWAKRSR